MNLTTYDFLCASRVIKAFVEPTPLQIAPSLGKRYDVELHTKHENLTPIRSFKVRGALYRLSVLSETERATGVTTASTGNHGMGIAFAARAFKTSAVVVVPEEASPLKLERLAELGADVRTSGSTLGEAIAAARQVALDEGRVFIEDGDDAELMIGAGTIALEVLTQVPTAHVFLVPVGGGNLIAGVAACAKQLNPRIQVIGVQSKAAAAVHASWKARRVVTRPATTFAGGLAADYPGRLALGVLSSWVDDIVLVSDDDLRRAMTLALCDIGQVLEGAGAASLAALAEYGDRWAGKVVIALLTGGNAARHELYEALVT